MEEKMEQKVIDLRTKEFNKAREDAIVALKYMYMDDDGNIVAPYGYDGDDAISTINSYLWGNR